MYDGKPVSLATVTQNAVDYLFPSQKKVSAAQENQQMPKEKERARSSVGFRSPRLKASGVQPRALVGSKPGLVLSCSKVRVLAQGYLAKSRMLGLETSTAAR